MGPPPAVKIEGHEEWEVEEVLESRTYRQQQQYLLKWLGWDAPTWQPMHDLENSSREVERYQLLHPTRPG